MTFKKTSLILFSATFLTSCSDYLIGKPKKDMVLEVKKESTECLGDIKPNMKKFFNSEGGDAELDKSFDCISATLKEFQQKAQGGVDADSFTQSELHQILSTFMKDAEISSEATKDILLLKSVVIGGSSQKVTKPEFNQIIDFLSAVRTELKILKKYSDIFYLKQNEKRFSKEQINSAYENLNQSIKNLIKLTKVAHAKYTFNDFKLLLSHLNLVSDEHQNLIVLADKMNNLVIGGHEMAGLDDYILYINSLTEVLRLYSYQIQGHVRLGIVNSDQMNNTFNYIHDIIRFLENTIQFKKTQQLTTDTIDPLIAEILKIDIIPFKISSEVALSLYKTLLIRIFESGLSGDINGFVGLKKIHITNIKRELVVYRIYNRIIGKIADTDLSKRFKVEHVRNNLRNIKAVDYQDLISEFDHEEQKMIIKIIDEIKNQYALLVPVLYRADKIILTTSQDLWDQNWQDLSRGLYNTMLARQLLLGWRQFSIPDEKSLNSTFVGEQGMTQWYSEFKSFGTELKIFDARSVKAAKNNLTSANLFTRSGDGDDKLTFTEAIQFVSILFSGGGQVYTELQEGLKNSNCNLPEQDVFGMQWTNEACAYDHLKSNYRNYFSNLPQLVGYLDKLVVKEDDFRSFYTKLMSVSRHNRSAEGRLETADLRNMTTVLHYVESIFSTYDSDKNSKLSSDEIRSSYYKFKIFAEKHARDTSGEALKKFSSFKGWFVGNSCFSESDLIKESFVFLVYYGRPPAQEDFNLFPCVKDKPNLFDFEGEVDRGSILNTLKIVKDVLG